MRTRDRNHVVASMHSKRFADEAGKLHWYDTSDPRRGIQYVTPDGSFWKWRQYVEERPIVGADGVPLVDKSGREQTTRSDATEIFLADKVETPTSLLLDRIIDPVVAGTLPPITEDERQLLQRFWFHQYIRAPGSLERVMPLQDEKTFFDDLQLKVTARRGGQLTEAERLLVEPSDRRNQMMKNAYVRAVRDLDPDGLALLRSCGMFYIVAPEKMPFVVASDPITLLGDPEKRNLGDGMAMGILPISSRVALCFGRSASGGTITRIDSEQHIFDFNRMVVEQSDSFGSGQKEIVEALMPFARSHADSRYRGTK